jgi:hypothetical protein
VKENRGQLLGAGLTILRGYFAIGKPNMQLKPWGSYEGWSDLVRSAVKWSGMSDPGDTRQELRKSSDQDAMALPIIIAGLETLDPRHTGLTISDLVQKIEQNKEDTAVKAMREAILMTCKSRGKDFPSPDSIGMKFRHLKGRVVAGKYLHRKEGRYAEWCVNTVGEG